MAEKRRASETSKEERDYAKKQVILWKQAVTEAVRKFQSDEEDDEDSDGRQEDDHDHPPSSKYSRKAGGDGCSSGQDGDIVPEGLSTDQFSLLLTAVKGVATDSNKRMEHQLSDLRSEMRREQREVAARRSKKTKATEFRRKGNEDQHKFNEELQDALVTVEEELERCPVEKVPKRLESPLKKAKETLREGLCLLEDRQKKIRLADRSDCGWDLVREYEADELADDSDDEKKIRKAEKAAEQRLAGKKKLAENKKKRFRSREQYRPAGASMPYEPRAPYRPWSGPVVPVSKGDKSGPVGPCYKCHEYGHLKHECRKGRPNKYPLLYGSCSNSHIEDSVQECVNEAPLEVKEPKQLHERCESVIEPCVKGRLCSNYKYWETVLKAPEPILSIIRQGYVLPFSERPEGKVFKNQKSAFMYYDFVSEAVADLLKNGCIRQVQQRPLVCSPLLVVVGGTGKRRLVINLRYVNQFLQKEKFKYEDMRTALMLFEKGDFISVFDLKSGYHHVDINEQSQEYLGFEWHQLFYVFTVLPFGLSTACYVFTKLMRPLVRLWRGKGIRSVVFIDDGIIVANGLIRAQHDSARVRESLEAAGFVINVEKSLWEPKQRGQWLGFDLDLAQGYISIPEQKIEQLKLGLRQISEARFTPAKLLASIVGRIMAMGLGMGPVVRLRTRSMYDLLNSRSSWYEELVINEDVREELVFWQSCMDGFNGQKLWKSASSLRVVYSDASGTGFGGYTIEHGCHIAHGQWNESERKKSSTWRELAAVARVLEAVSDMLTNHRVKWFTDNQNVTRIIRVGSRVAELQEVALKIFKVMLYNNICIEPEWIPREENAVADSFSRIIDYDDWSINPSVFCWLDSLWGPHSVDRFANSYNKQTNRFNSRFWDIGTEAVDTFTVDWSEEYNWWCPPLYLVCRVLQHARVCKSSGTLIVPQWESAVFWPVLCPDGKHFAEFVQGVIQLPHTYDLIVPGKLGASLPVGHSHMLALRISFN